MAATRVNVMIPSQMLAKSQKLIKQGFFSNFSELVRNGIRTELLRYESQYPELSSDERKLLLLMKKADAEGILVSEKEMQEHGLKI